MKRKFFISYRRQSSGTFAEAIFNHLQKQSETGSVFYDRDPKSLPAGSDWPKELISKILQTDVILVIIDSSWTEELAHRNRVDGKWIKDTDSIDWVRREVMFGLHFGKTIIPLLFDNSPNLTEADLPYDLTQLAAKNALSMDTSYKSFSKFDEHLGEMDQVQSIPYIPPKSYLKGQIQVGDDLWSKFGKSWIPKIADDSPHRWDYKYMVTNPDERMRLRIALLASRRTGILENGFSLADLAKLGQHRCFGQSENKQGMFLQASCIVTDGRKGKTENLLMTLRHDYQFHDEVYGDNPEEESIRNVKGESCLIGTCLSDFSYHGNTAHLSRAIFNDLYQFNPWAIFSRKLLIPALFVDSKFLGIGYNLSNPEKEYIHLVWHVATQDCPPAMLVPAREKAKFDLARWESLDRVKQYDFEDCGIDRLAVESLLGVALPEPNDEKKALTLFHGFAKYKGLEGTFGVNDHPHTWRREAIPIDLIRMFQQICHGKVDKSDINNATELKASFSTFLAKLDETDVTKDFTILLEDKPHENGSIISLKDQDGNKISYFHILYFVTDDLNLSELEINFIRDNSLNLLDNGNHAAATIVIQGVRTSQRYTLNGAELLSTDNNSPIHLIKIALKAPKRLLKRVVHAIIPIRMSQSADIEHCLFTREFNDETQRLPGGKIENAESPEQALVRELEEELDLNIEEFEIHQVILPNGRTSTEVSPSSGELTDYQLIPMLVAPINTGINKLQKHLKGITKKTEFQIKPETLSNWTTGLGYDNSYAKEVVARLSKEALEAAAFSTK